MRDTLRTISNRIRSAFHKNEFERVLDDELRAHVEAEADVLIRAGVPAA